MKAIMLGELLEIAAAGLGVSSRELGRATSIELAESALHAPFAGTSEVELYATLPEKAAVLCSRIVRNHPFPDGNKRAGYLAMIELAERNGYRFDDGDQDEIADMVEALAAGVLDELSFIEWATARMAPAPDRLTS